MGITSLDIMNNLSTHRAKIINILDFNSEKLSIIRTNKNKIHVYYDHNPFFLAVDNLKGYFEHHDDKNNIVGRAKNNKYLTIIFTSEYQKLMYTEIFKKINKDINKNYVKIKFESNDNVPLNILVNIHTLVLVVRYQRVYIPVGTMNFMKKFNYEIIKYKTNKVKELKIYSTLWATPSKIVNLLDFKPEKIVIETERNTNNDMKVHNARYENGGFYLTIDNVRGYFNFSNNLGTLIMLFADIDQQDKYHQEWK